MPLLQWGYGMLSDAIFLYTSAAGNFSKVKEAPFSTSVCASEPETACYNCIISSCGVRSYFQWYVMGSHITYTLTLLLEINTK